MSKKAIGIFLIVALLLMGITYQQVESSNVSSFKDGGDHHLRNAERTVRLNVAQAESLMAIAYYLRDIRDELREMND